MSLDQPRYWLAYISEDVETGPAEVTAIAPEVLPRPGFTRDARVVLAAADAYHDANPRYRVVFLGSVTRWLHTSRGIRWADLDVDLDDALADLDLHSPALLIEAASVTTAVVANAATHLDLVWPDGRIESGDEHTEPVRAAIQAVLERDWSEYINRVVAAAR
jgi:hypothetical protein